MRVHVFKIFKITFNWGYILIVMCYAILSIALWPEHKCFSEYYNLHLTISNNRQVSNTRRTLVGNQIVDHSDVVGASPVGAAPTTSSFST